MKCILASVLTVWVCFFYPAATLGAAEDHPSSTLALKTEAIVEAACAYVLEHQDDMSVVQDALQHDPRFSNHEMGLYVFMHWYDSAKKEAICCAQGVRPELVGKNMWHLRTPNGRLLFHEIINIIEHDGEGWIEYDWLNPYAKKIQTKVSFVRGISLKDGRKAWVGCGYWKSDRNRMRIR